MKSGNPNFLEPSGPLQACNGTTLPYKRSHQDALIKNCASCWLLLYEYITIHGHLNVKLEFILKLCEFFVHVGFKCYMKQKFAKDRVNYIYN